MRKVSEIERCALTLLSKALNNISYEPLYYAVKRFLRDTGSPDEEKWTILALKGLNPLYDDLDGRDKDMPPVSANWWYEDYHRERSVTVDYPTAAHMFATLKKEAWCSADSWKAYRQWDIAIYYLMADIIAHREAEAEGEGGDRTVCLDTMGPIYISTSLAANVVEFHTRCLSAKRWETKAHYDKNREDD